MDKQFSFRIFELLPEIGNILKVIIFPAKTTNYSRLSLGNFVCDHLSATEGCQQPWILIIRRKWKLQISVLLKIELVQAKNNLLVTKGTSNSSQQIIIKVKQFSYGLLNLIFPYQIIFKLFNLGQIFCILNFRDWPSQLWEAFFHLYNLNL